MLRTRKAKSQSAKPTTEFRPDLDVICGHSQRHHSNSGTNKFQKLIEAQASDYAQSKTSTAKSNVVSSIIEEVRSRGGRFLKVLKAQSDGHTYVEASEKCVRDKVGFALRQQIRNQTRDKRRRSSPTLCSICSSLSSHASFTKTRTDSALSMDVCLHKSSTDLSRANHEKGPIPQLQFSGHLDQAIFVSASNLMEEHMALLSSLVHPTIASLNERLIALNHEETTYDALTVDDKGTPALCVEPLPFNESAFHVDINDLNDFLSDKYLLGCGKDDKI